MGSHLAALLFASKLTPATSSYGESFFWPRFDQTVVSTVVTLNVRGVKNVALIPSVHSQPILFTKILSNHWQRFFPAYWRCTGGRRLRSDRIDYSKDSRSSSNSLLWKRSTFCQFNWNLGRSQTSKVRNIGWGGWAGGVVDWINVSVAPLAPTLPFLNSSCLSACPQCWWGGKPSWWCRRMWKSRWPNWTRLHWSNMKYI